jgi:hypothetical protein
VTRWTQLSPSCSKVFLEAWFAREAKIHLSRVIAGSMPEVERASTMGNVRIQHVAEGILGDEISQEGELGFIKTGLSTYFVARFPQTSIS